MPRRHTALTRALFRTSISAYDFAQALAFIDAAKKADRSSIEYWALMLAAIICYARPFSPNERRPIAADRRLEVDAKMLRGILEEKEGRVLHRRIVRLRNKTVAHSESRFAYLRTFRAPSLSRQRKGSKDIVIQMRHWHPFNEQIDLVLFRNIAQAMQTYCRFGRHELATAVYEERRRLRRG